MPVEIPPPLYPNGARWQRLRQIDNIVTMFLDVHIPCGKPLGSRLTQEMVAGHRGTGVDSSRSEVGMPTRSGEAVLCQYGAAFYH